MSCICNSPVRPEFKDSYKDLLDKPSINGVTLEGNLTTADLGIETEGILRYKVRNEPIICTVPYVGVSSYTLDLEFLNRYITGEKLQDDTLYIIASTSTPIVISMEEYVPLWIFKRINGFTDSISANRIGCAGPLYILGGRCYFVDNPEAMANEQ